MIIIDAMTDVPEEDIRRIRVGLMTGCSDHERTPGMKRVGASDTLTGVHKLLDAMVGQSNSFICINDYEKEKFACGAPGTVTAEWIQKLKNSMSEFELN